MRSLLALVLFFSASFTWAEADPTAKRNPAEQESLPPQPEQTDGTVPVEVSDTPKEGVDTPTAKKVEVEHAVSPDEKDWLILGNFSYIDIIVPAKIGVTGAYRLSPTSFVELDYMRGSISSGLFGVSLGSIVEERAGLFWRKFVLGRSFNFLLGAHYNKLSVNIGDSALSTVSAGNFGDYQLGEFATLGLSAGLGHRWVWPSGLTFAIDWAQIHVPMYTVTENIPLRDVTNDPDRLNEIDTLVRLVKYWPRIAVLKLQLGVSF